MWPLVLQVFREAKRTAPSILYMPHIDRWWSVLSDTLQATFLTLVHDMDPSAPVLLLATSDSSYVILESTVSTRKTTASGKTTSSSIEGFFFSLNC